MKKLTPFSLLATSVLLILLSGTSASAGMKCGDGKCGSSMKEAATNSGEDKKESMKEMKCGSGKCGSMKATAPSDTNTTQAK
ncbi:MAG: hypothetical protein NTW78_02590 [Campylobacterales bacterium]|nr:hypothetical protein [Campylobacterales bacterium]